MTIAYFIVAHHKPRQLARLLDALHDPADSILVHVDRKAPAAVREAIARHAAARPNVDLLPSRRIAWGGWSLAEIHLDAIRRLLERDRAWRWFANLSGQDFPLRSPDAIRAELEAAPERNHLEAAPIDAFPEPERRRLRRRLQFRYVEAGGEVVETTQAPERPAGVRVDWKGAGWFTLTRAFCEWIVADPLAHRCAAAVRHAFIPDELLMQTLAMNGPFRGTVTGDPRRMIRWTPGARHPETLTMRDRDALLASTAHFARKFDEDVDPEILDLLARRSATPAGA